MLRFASLALASAIVLVGCDGLNSDAQSPDLVVGTVPLTYGVYLDQVDDGRDDGLALVMGSEQGFGCVNHQIINEARERSGTLSVGVKGVSKAEICLTMNGPAIASIPLPMDRDRLHLRFDNGGVIDTATLVFEADSVRVVSATQRASKPQAPAFSW